MEAYAIPNREAVTVAKKLLDEMFCQFSLPEKLHSDQGRQFEGDVVTQLCQLVAIEKTHTTLLRAIDGFARSIDCAAPSMDPLIAHLSINRAIVDRSRNHLWIAHYCACAIDGWNMLHVLWCETVLQLLRHYLKPVASFTTIASCRDGSAFQGAHDGYCYRQRSLDLRAVF